MTRAEINSIIRNELRNYGHGFAYDIWLASNGKSRLVSSSDLRRLANEGDFVSIDVYRRSRWGKYHVNTVEFTFDAYHLTAASEADDYASQFKRIRDNQRKRVYRFEWATVDKMEVAQEKLTDKQIADLFDDICDSYGIPVEERAEIEVTARRSAKSCYSNWRKKIFLAEGNGGWGRCTNVVLHEAAHFLLHAFGYGYNVQPHGPEFVAVAVDLYVKYLGADRDWLMREIKERRIKIAKNFNLKK